ncbi:MAG: diaminopimelate decarboxylase [Nitrospiraceae bacterium]|nr:MAG: diaminopimelate decarboxylase [Nitrospiraceae bacterium]
MHDFIYRKSELYAEDVPVRKIVEKAGTPLYIYSYNTLVRHYSAYKEAFDGYPNIICFALKANSNPALLKILAKEGSGADVVSGGELFFALKAGIPAKNIVYAGVGKTEQEIEYALKSRILMFNIESSDELAAIDKVAGRLKVKAPIALRVNPDISASTHPYISTGLKKHKFGIPINKALEYYSLANSLRNVEVVGIHKHIGSQITRTTPFVDALKKVLVLADSLKSRGIEIRYLDMGGGLGIPYNNEEDLPKPGDLAKAIMPLIKLHNFTLIIEPGRSIVGNAGILVTKVLYLKKHLRKEFVIVDAGMNDLIRPSLYDAYHHIQPVKKNARRIVYADVVGPICESGDFFAKGRKMNSPRHEDLLAVMSAGAYGFSMSSNYNGRKKAAEVLVKGKEFFVVREREEYKDLIKGTSIPGFLK